MDYEGVNLHNNINKQQAIFMKMQLKKKIANPNGIENI